MLAALFTGTHIQVAAAALAFICALATIGWRSYRAAKRAGKVLAGWIDDRMAITAAQIADPIVEAQQVAHQMMRDHLDDCRQERANTNIRLRAVEKSVIDIAERTTPAPK